MRCRDTGRGAGRPVHRRALPVHRLALLCCLTGLGPLPALGWEDFELLRPPTGQRKPLDPIRLAGVPDGIGMGAEQGGGVGIRVELDQDRWSGEAYLESNVLVLVPTTPIAGGVHRLRIFQGLSVSAPECPRCILERGDWMLEIHSTRAARQAWVALDATVEVATRVAVSGPADSRRQPSEGSAWLAAGLANGPSMEEDLWSLQAAAALVHGRRSFGLATARSFDLATFRAAAAVGPVTVQAGDHALPPGLASSLVLAPLHRRGVSVRLDLAPAELALTGFAIAAAPVIGSTAGFGIEDPGSRLEGAVLSRDLVASSSQISLVAVYLDGEGAAGSGAGLAGDSTSGAGRAWSLGIRGQILDRLGFSAELAESIFDIDVADSTLDRRRDDAYALSATLQPRHERPLGRRPRWQLGLERRRVGTFFRSLAHPHLPNDRDTLAGHTRLRWPRLEVQVDWRRHENNVNRLARLPNLRSDNASLTASFRPLASTGRAGQEGHRRQALPLWLRPHVLTLSLDHSDEETLDLAPAVPAADSLRRSLHLGASGAFWNLGYRHDRLEQAAGSGSELTNEQVDLRLDLAQQKWSLAPTLEWHRLRGGPARLDQTTALLRLSSFITFNDRLSGGFAIDTLQERFAGATVDRWVRTLSADLSWIVRKPRLGLPGLALRVRGHHTDHDGTERSLRAATSEAFLGLRVAWRSRF